LINQCPFIGIGRRVVGMEVEEFYVSWFQVSGFRFQVEFIAKL
jgi:hypothetical protein